MILGIPNTVTGPRPSYARKFARNAAQSAYPGLRGGVLANLPPLLGPTRGTLRDVRGRNNGTLVNMDPFDNWLPSEVGPCLDFDQPDTDYVQLARSFYDLGMRTHGTTTVLFRAVNDGLSRTLFGDWTANRGQACRVNPDETMTYFVFPNDGVDHRVNTVATINVDRWNVVSAVVSGANILLYLNGAQVGTAAFGHTVSNAAANISIGRRGDANAYYDGQIANFIIHGRAITLSEHRRLYVTPDATLRLRYQTLASITPPAGNSWWYFEQMRLRNAS